MDRRSIWILCLVLATAAPMEARLRVVATLPDFSTLAETIGGSHVEVESLARGTEDPHFVDARPSFVRLLNKADLLLEGGAQLELGWLRPLVDNARNRKILEGNPGRVDMARGIQLQEVPSAPVDRSMGDVHPAGNPHYWLDPANGLIMARHLCEVFSRIDPSHAQDYEANLHRFEAELKTKMSQWQQLMEPLRGMKVVTYHKSYEYFARRFGLEIVDQIEPKPGLEPSPSHIAHLIDRWRGQGVKLILAEPNRPRRTAQYVADKLGAQLLMLPIMVGGGPGIRDSFDLFDYDIGQITGALKAP